MDKRFYTITYNDLDRILGRYDFALKNPHNNYIDVVKYEQKRIGILNPKLKTEERFVCQIGFPAWTKQVSQDVIKVVRSKTGLTHDKGYDSQTFYRGIEDTRVLIAHYQEQLQHLAHR